MIEMSCPHCGQALRIEEKYAGKRGACKHCQKPVTVPLVETNPNTADPFAKTDHRVLLQAREDKEKGGDIPFGEMPVVDPFARASAWDKNLDHDSAPASHRDAATSRRDTAPVEPLATSPFLDDDWEPIDTSAFGPPPGAAQTSPAPGKLGRFLGGLASKLRPKG